MVVSNLQYNIMLKQNVVDAQTDNYCKDGASLSMQHLSRKRLGTIGLLGNQLQKLCTYSEKYKKIDKPVGTY